MTRATDLTPLLKRLQLGPMTATLPERIALARREQLDYASFLEIILSDEVNRRAHRRIEMRLQGAGFQEICRLEDFDWPVSITMDRRLLDAAFSLEFLARHEHVLLVGPRKRTVEQPLSEFSHRRTQLGGAGLDAVGHPGGVGGKLGRVVVGIGGPPALGLADVGLDQPAPVIDAHQLAAQPDLHLLTRRAQGRRHRVQGVLAGHVMIGMHLDGAPVGDLVGLAIPRGERLPLLVEEHHQGLTPGGAVCPAPGARRHGGTSGLPGPSHRADP